MEAEGVENSRGVGCSSQNESYLNIERSTYKLHRLAQQQYNTLLRDLLGAPEE